MSIVPCTALFTVEIHLINANPPSLFELEAKGNKDQHGDAKHEQ